MEVLVGLIIENVVFLWVLVCFVILLFLLLLISLIVCFFGFFLGLLGKSGISILMYFGLLLSIRCGFERRFCKVDVFCRNLF